MLAVRGDEVVGTMSFAGLSDFVAIAIEQQSAK
jgi:hypothetical protein